MRKQYIYRKKQLGGIDRRLRYLQKRLDELNVVENKPSDPDKVFFGAWVVLEDEQGKQVKYRIVGPDEFDEQDAYISMDSPVARALLGKRLDDEVSVQTPKGKQVYVIMAVAYSGEDKTISEA